jgi:hypothetical protein
MFVGLEVIVAVAVKSTFFWVVTPYSLERIGCLRGTYYSPFHGRRISQARNQEKHVASFSWFLALPLDPQDGGDVFL